MEESRPDNGLNKESLSPASLYLTMNAKLLETMKEILYADSEIDLGMRVAQPYGTTSILRHDQ